MASKYIVRDVKSFFRRKKAGPMYEARIFV